MHHVTEVHNVGITRKCLSSDSPLCCALQMRSSRANLVHSTVLGFDDVRFFVYKLCHLESCPALPDQQSLGTQILLTNSEHSSMTLPGMLAGQQAPPAGTKQPASCLHLPVPRVLLITVVFALMAIPLLLFTAGRVQVHTSFLPKKI